MRWMLIGASTIAAQYMIRAIRAQEGSNVLFLLSSSAERGSVYAREHGIPASGTDLKEALSDPHIDAVYISSTNEKHLHQAMAAIEAGKHVLCEKPLAMTVADAISIVRAAENAGVILATNHHLRCSGSHRAVRSLIRDGRVGRVLSLRLHHAVYLPSNLQDWRINSVTKGGGVILDIAVHDADVVRFLLGEDPEAVVAQMGMSGMGQGVEDSAMSVWTMPSGIMVASHESFTHPFAGSGLEVHGSEGSVFARNVMTQNPVGEIELVTASGRESISFDGYDLYVQSVREFENAVAGVGMPAATGWDGVKSLAVALAIRESSMNGQRVSVNYGGVK